MWKLHMGSAASHNCIPKKTTNKYRVTTEKEIKELCFRDQRTKKAGKQGNS